MLKILLIEDDLIVQRVHQMMLTKLGCEVDIVASGHAALSIINESGIIYSIIFVDIGLPDISGFNLIRLIRHREANKQIPIIALTGYAGPVEREACLEAGATEVAYKPIINSALREILERHKSTS